MRTLLTKLSRFFSKKPNKRVLADKARIEAAQTNTKIYWVPKLGAKSCKDCVELAVNSPYTKDTLPCYPGDGTTRCGNRCQCKLLIRVAVKKGEEEYKWAGPLHPFDKNRQPRPELYGKFKNNIPEFRFFVDKNLGDGRAAKKEFKAAVNAAGVGLTASNYDDPHNPRFFPSNKFWLEIQEIRKSEKQHDFKSKECTQLRKKRQKMMQQLVALNKDLEKDGLRWIRPDGYEGYKVRADGRPKKKQRK